MRSKTFILVAGFLVALLVGAGAVYGYDRSQREVIAQGVTVGGIDVGGMRPAAARQRLRRELLAPLAAPVRVRYGNRRFTLPARRARVSADLSASVDEALQRSREGTMISRAARGLTHERLHADVTPTVTFSRRAVSQLVDRVRGSVERPARDATIAFSGSGLQRVEGQAGVRIDENRLRRQVEGRLLSRGSRSVRVRARRIRPKVTSSQLGRRYPTVVTVDRSAFQLRLYRNLRMVKSYRIAVGQAGLETPAGMYRVQSKEVNPTWHVPDSAWAGKLAGRVIPGGTAENPLKARWMGIYNGAGIHGTDAVGSLGSAASHGCIRMAVPDVIDLYGRVAVQTPVFIS